jgi:cytochrome b
MVKPTETSNKKVWVWDLSVRMGHWLLAICFATAYATGESESWRLWHVYSGSGVLAIVCFRVLWGFIGTPYARFSDFVRHPSHAVRYLKNLTARKPEHYVGHNPAGGLAVIALLGLSATTAVIGWVIYQGSPPRWLEEAHELVANLTLVLVVVHIAAVIVSSKLHQENLIKTMITGSKSAFNLKPNHPPFNFWSVALGLALLVFFLSFAGYAVAVWS